MFQKNIFCQLLCIILLSTLSTFGVANQTFESNLPQGMSYEVRKEKNHVIHILSIDPTLCRLQLVKAHNQVFGRETVPAIALRTNALVAINAGFFEIGNSEDGRASGTLIIDGTIFSLAKDKRAILQLDGNKVNLINAELNFKMVVNEASISPDTINQFTAKNEVALYNHVWGPNSLTPYERHEVLIDKNGVITNILNHGDNAIPSQGWILSVPKSYPLSRFKLGQKVSFEISLKDDEKDILWQGTESIIMGIPLLIKQGQVVQNLEKSAQKDFVILPHARTALGVKPNGTIVIMVSEHNYKQPLDKITLKEAQNILKDKQYSKEKMKVMTVPEMMTILKKDSIKNSNIIGLTLPELAKMMLDLGCVDAINLDGGGSSTLFLNGRVVNSTIGDTDEKMGQAVSRPVSNAIVIKSG